MVGPALGKPFTIHGVCTRRPNLVASAAETSAHDRAPARGADLFAFGANHAAILHAVDAGLAFSPDCNRSARSRNVAPAFEGFEERSAGAANLRSARADIPPTSRVSSPQRSCRPTDGGPPALPISRRWLQWWSPRASPGLFVVSPGWRHWCGSSLTKMALQGKKTHTCILGEQSVRDNNQDRAALRAQRLRSRDAACEDNAHGKRKPDER